MDTTAPCNCQLETEPKTSNQRPRYYARQLVTPEDMTLEQDYFRAKLRRHNLFLHGWGVVCGARVVASATPWKLIVKRGYILGPCGDEIWLEKDVCFDVRTKCASSDTAASPDDPECAEAQPPASNNTLRYIAIRYKEIKARLIRIPAGGCGCETTTCEVSRLVDGYEICVLDECPNPPGDAPSFDALHQGDYPDCPPAATSPWVVLAAFTVDGENKALPEETECRRQVMGCGGYWWARNGAENPNDK
jgi:hypothetical protein